MSLQLMPFRYKHVFLIAAFSCACGAYTCAKVNGKRRRSLQNQDSPAI